MKVAVLGLGAMGRRHLRAVAQVPELELVALADHSPQSLDAAEAPAGVLRGLDAVSVLQASRPDLAVIATHAPSHHALTQAALQAGVRRILCEKPMASSVAEADAMVEAARAHGARLAVNHGRRVEPLYRWVAERVGSGEWGELRSVRITCPGIGLGCVGIHYLDLMRMLSGDEMTSVTGWIDPERGPNPRGAEFHDPGGVVVAEGRSGARYLHQHIEDGGGPAPVVVETTGARFTVVEDTGAMEWLRRWPGERSFRPSPLPEGLAFELDVVKMTAALLRELAGEGPLSCPGTDGRASLELLAAAYASHRRGHRPVPLPLEGADRAQHLAIT
jgi:predicted dehydrogenase